MSVVSTGLSPPRLRKKTMTESEVIVIMPSTPSVPTWLIQVNMLSTGSSPRPAKTASTTSAITVCTTEPTCGL